MSETIAVIGAGTMGRGIIEVAAVHGMTVHAVELEPAVADAVCVIEAVPELEDLKLGLFKTLDSVCGSETILASNTSSISITRLAAATNRPTQVVGMHFFNPVPVMPPVEIVRGLQTSDETVERT